MFSPDQCIQRDATNYQLCWYGSDYTNLETPDENMQPNKANQDVPRAGTHPEVEDSMPVGIKDIIRRANVGKLAAQRLKALIDEGGEEMVKLEVGTTLKQRDSVAEINPT